MVKKTNLLKLIEPHFENYLVKDSYEVKTMKSKNLLTHIRFDLAFKLLYLEMKDKDVKFAKEIYIEHIRAFTLGKFTEPGNDDKNSIDTFLEEFDKTFEDIKTNGFDSSKTLIPLSQNGSIVNGAHRVASAMYLGKEVECVQIETGNNKYDYQFFYSRNVSRDILDTVATKFVEYADNVYIAIVWPTAVGHDEEIEKIIPNIVYRKNIDLNPNGAHNLISQIYYGEEWLGSVEDNFRGSQNKLLECFKYFDPLRVIAFQAYSLDQVLKIKNKIRDIFDVGKHSIHITDTKEEAIRTARIVFNDNSVHFLNYAKPNKYISTHRKIDTFKEFINANTLNSNDVLLDSSIILSAYGLREAKDTDYFCYDNSKIKVEFDDINIHDEELKYYGENKNDMIYNQKFYFYFNEIKFISFTQLYKMKTNRDEEKDKNDCKMMKALIENNKFKELLNKFKQSIYYQRIKLRIYFFYILKKTRLYNIIRSVYRVLKGKT